MFDILVDEEEEALVNIHSVCKDNKVSYILTSNEGENTYNLTISSTYIKSITLYNYKTLVLLLEAIKIFLKV